MITQLGLGGTEQQLVLLAQGLRDAEVEVDVIALYEGGPRVLELEAMGVPVEVLGMCRPPRHPLRTLTHGMRLMRRLRDRRPDVVHAFLFDSYVLACPLAKAAGVPVVVAGRRALSNYKAGRPVARALERLSTRTVDLIIANASAVAADVVAHEHLPESDVVVIPNALSPEARTTAARSAPAAVEPSVICVANLWSYKGHHDLLQAVQLLDARGVRFRLLLVGDGPERTRLQMTVTEHELPVEFFGARQDVPALLASSDIFVLPSHTEGMSNALMEAMAAGLPVVATDVGGNADVVGTAGLLCPSGRPDLLAAALEQVLCDPETRSRLGAAGVARAAGWTVDELARRHLEEYGKVLARRCAA